MRVAFIVNVFPALSETFILRQITGLIERGHKVDIFALSRTKETTVHRDVEKFNLLASTHYLTPYRPTSSKLLRLMKRLRLLFRSFHKNPQAVLSSLDVTKFGKKALLLQILCEITPFFGRGPYDILHCQFGTLGSLGLLLRDTGIFRGKVVTSFRGYDVSSHTKAWGENIYSDLFERGDLFLCVSERIRDQLAILGCDEQKLLVHRSGVDIKKFHSPPRKPKSDEMTRILTVARLVEKKGIEYGIQAVATIVEKRPHVEYVIAGGGPLQAKLQNIIRERKVSNYIKLIGWKSEDEIVDLLVESDILLAPSLTTLAGDEEGIPGAIMEAFARGLPVVSTRHSAIPEVVRDGESGFLVPERNADALAEKLNFLIDRPELRFAMGQQGRSFVEEHYDIDRLNDRLETLYRQLLHGDVTQSTFESLEPVPLRRH